LPRPATTGSPWDLLRHNRAANLPVFQAAAIETEQVRILACPDCGLRESAVFWTVTRRSQRRLKLRCPGCGNTSARYDLRRNTASSPGSAGRVVVLTWALAVFLLGALVLLVMVAPGLGEWLAERWPRVIAAPLELLGDLSERLMGWASRRLSGGATAGVP
jgi:hypothetical protein